MIKRIDLFAPPRSRYHVLHYMTECLAAALMKQGVKCRLFDQKSTKDPEKFFHLFQSDRPDLTLSLNGLLPDQEGNFFCDLVAVPHLAYLVDSPPHFFSLSKSPYTIIACIDRFFTKFFKEFPDTNVLFSPHGASGEKKVDPAEKRPYDIVLLGSYFDADAIRANWKKKYSLDLCMVLEEAAERTFSDTAVSFIEAFTEAMNVPVKSGTINPEKMDIAALLIDLEDYIRAVDRSQLIRALDGLSIHIFGDGGWDKMSHQKNVHIHPAIEFVDALEVMSQAKIVINSTPQIKDGGHERFFSAYMQGALPLASDNQYLMELFPQGEQAIYYQPLSWGEAAESIHEILSHEEKRIEMVKAGRGNVLRNHTWDKRAEILLEELPPLLDKLL